MDGYGRIIYGKAMDRAVLRRPRIMHYVELSDIVFRAYLTVRGSYRTPSTTANAGKGFIVYDRKCDVHRDDRYGTFTMSIVDGGYSG